MSVNAHELIYEHQGVRTRLRAVEKGILRVTRTCRPQFLGDESPVVTIASSQEGMLETDGLSAGTLRVRVDRATGALSFETQEGFLLLREPGVRPYQLTERPVFIRYYDENTQVEQHDSVDGVRARAHSARTEVDRTAYECCQRFVFDPQEALYGLGSHEEGYGNLRGRSRLLYQHNLKAVVPVLVSTKGWGILFDMGCMMAFHDDEHGAYLWADLTDELDWYFFYGDGSYAALMERYRALTGETPMLPKYALGYIQSKERYKDQAELIEVAEEYRRQQIPLDMIVLDWQSWPQGQWGWKHFDPSRFPSPKTLTAELHRRDVRLMVSVWPSMQGEQNTDRAQMMENGCMLGNRLIYNAFLKKARDLYWKQAKEALFDQGVDAWWCDCTEPFESDWSGEIKPEPFRRAALNTDEAKRYLDPTKINLFSLYHSQGIYQGQREATSEKRVCNLTRSSYAGQHRSATITWSGDVSANWETLRRHIPEGLNFMAAGEGYWSTDIGGFFTRGGRGPWFCEGGFDRGVDDPAYRELYVRWAQYAAFLPMMRSHGTDTPREVWRFGQRGERARDALEGAIRLRYGLVPLLYTLMARLNARGIPMLTPPALLFPQDRALIGAEGEMMLGDSLLVKPVTHPLAQAEQEEILLPAGSDWYDFASGRRFAGGERVVLPIALDSVPMFLRAGSILPWGAAVQSTSETSCAPLEIIVAPGADADFCLYDDEGDGYGYEQGRCSILPLCWREAERTLTIGPREGRYPGMPGELGLRVRLAGGPAQELRFADESITVKL